MNGGNIINTYSKHGTWKISTNVLLKDIKYTKQFILVVPMAFLVINLMK